MDDLHVNISADEQAAADLACEMVQPLLDPSDPMHSTASGNFLAHIMSGRRSRVPATDASGAAAGIELPRTGSAPAAAAAAAAAAAIAPNANPQQYARYSQDTGVFPTAAAHDAPLPGPPPAGAVAPSYATSHQTYHPPSIAGVVDPHCKLFVGHLPNSITDAMLHGLFSHYGQVRQAEVMRHRESQVSRGFGFVHMQTREQAAAAIAALNMYRVEGRTLQVSVKVWFNNISERLSCMLPHKVLSHTSTTVIENVCA